MTNYSLTRYYATVEEVRKIVSDARERFFLGYPDYRPFENDISSYIARAVQLRNEKGVSRPSSYQEDQAKRIKYLDELYEIAKKEAWRCLDRFQESVAVLQKQAQSDKETEVQTVKSGGDITDIPLTW